MTISWASGASPTTPTVSAAGTYSSPPLQVAVCGCNACHVRTMLALGIIVVGHVQILVNVAEAKGRLQVYVQTEAVRPHIAWKHSASEALRAISSSSSTSMAFRYSLVVHVGIAGILCQSHCQGQGIKGLMIGIQTSVDDGNPGACAGVAGLPRRGWSRSSEQKSAYWVLP